PVDMEAADDHVRQPEDEHRDEEPGDAEGEDRERKGEELQHGLYERREQTVDERREDQRPERAADGDAGEDPRSDRQRGGVDRPGDEDAYRERHAAIVTTHAPSGGSRLAPAQVGKEPFVSLGWRLTRRSASQEARRLSFRGRTS